MFDLPQFSKTKIVICKAVNHLKLSGKHAAPVVTLTNSTLLHTVH
jgi:hypothetical protein